ncbi:vWA domain-containing protein [Litorihabitans aurantiacus]|uniref:VWFA domain-containing protein n=1 Tax=Litorihabitans aurantiacus TaxID=1930061 RepID=A0AA37XGE5_9MICO|nr:hypothetical protein [Litorihabitans aurantiacus]GMA32791.1 hypothetical protein GCM10025875_27830 [Litorihabitans aurantiacus]
MVTSALERPWLIALAVVVLLAVAVFGYLTRTGPQRPDGVRWVANASYLTQLASFRSRLTRYRVGLGAVAVVALTGGVAAGVLLARPVDRQVLNSELATRDIVLCLDVSGSMVEYDAEIVDQFLTLVEGFDGERIALSIWNQTSRTVFPLTDDYALIAEELEAARTALDFDINAYYNGSYDEDALDRLLAFITGTELGGEQSSSLIGDGLASCGLLFDEADSERSRTIILASDNQVLGTPIYSLPDAADAVAEREIGLIGIYAGASTNTSAAEQKEYEDVVAAQEGLYFEASDPSAVDAIIDRIQSQQAIDLDATPEVVVTDRPVLPATILVVAFGALVVLLWRLRT